MLGTTGMTNRGGAALEKSRPGKPSRRSTRKATGRPKSATNLARQSICASNSPKAKASKAAAKNAPKKVGARTRAETRKK